MVGNIHEEFVFTFFASKEPFTKIKTAKLLSTWKVNEPRFNVSTDTHQHKDTSTRTPAQGHQHKDKSRSSHCYKRPGYEATFLTTLEPGYEASLLTTQEQRDGIAISISKQFRYAFSS